MSTKIHKSVMLSTANITCVFSQTFLMLWQTVFIKVDLIHKLRYFLF